MDIFRFLRTVTQDNTSTDLPGLRDPQLRSFKHYFTHAFPKRFGVLTSAQILRFGVLNFVCQQLAVRATYAPDRNGYLFIGGGMDFAASVLGMVPVLKATWVREGADSWDEAHVRTCLSAGEHDDLREFTVRDHSIDETVTSCSEGTLGAVVFAGGNPIAPPLIEQAVSRLSEGGVALFPAHSDRRTPCSADAFECLSITHGALARAFSGGISLVRRRG